MTGFDRTRPFVLLDDARERGGGATLLHDPRAVIETHDPAGVRPALERLRGTAAAGFLSYEAGAALEPKLAPLVRAPGPDDPPLLWFARFAGEARLSPADLAGMLGDPAGARLGAPEPLVTAAWHAAAVAEIQALIAAGDIYQANLTFPAAVRVAGDPLALWARLRAARAGWGAVVFTGRHWLLSASPELFFEMADGVATARPMKGTAARRADPQADAAAARALVADPKQRAENLMIVDLMRNDLARVAAPGGVRVPALFAAEAYPTVHHMTSTVTAALRPGIDGVDVLLALFPCGSITGAPKLRACQVIDAVENRARGPYTGAIGRIDPAGPDGARAAFNVAIRTLVLADGADRAILGLGSAIVADSVASDEWAECLTKGKFVTAGPPPFDLIETMRFDAREGFVELERHLQRMKDSAAALGFAFDRHQVRNELQAASFSVRHDARVRLRLAPSGVTAIGIDPLPPEPDWPVAVAVVPRPLPPGDVRLHHKTSDRSAHERARRDGGTWEVLFVDEEGRPTEGSFTSLFVERADGTLATPPIARGMMEATLRRRLLEEGRAREDDLRVEDLRDGFLLGNALRGLFPARLVAGPERARL